MSKEEYGALMVRAACLNSLGHIGRIMRPISEAVAAAITAANPGLTVQVCPQGAMVTMDVHGRDVLTAMVAAGVDSLNDFNWMSQLRYYYEPKDDEDRKVVGNRDIAIRMITAQAKFG